jgi:hypothetical protein
MNLTVPLSSEVQAELQRRAAAAGHDLTTYIAEALRQHLEADDGLDVHGRRSADEWIREFHDWVSRQKSRNPNVDDRRESIYD